MIQIILARDLLPFLALMAFVLSAIMMAFHFLSSQYADEFETFDRSAFTAYRLMLGSFEHIIFEERPWMLAFFYGYTFLVNIVLFNLLIAIIGDSFEKVLDKRDDFKHVMLSELLSDLEQLDMPASELESNELFPMYLHMAWRRDVATGQEEEDDEWHGRMKAFNKMVMAGIAAIKKLTEELFKGQTDQLKRENAELKKDTAELKKDAEELKKLLNAKMEEMTQLLSERLPTNVSSIEGTERACSGKEAS